MEKLQNLSLHQLKQRSSIKLLEIPAIRDLPILQRVADLFRNTFSGLRSRWRTLHECM